MSYEGVCYKILYNKDGQAIGVEDPEGVAIDGNDPPDPFAAEKIIAFLSDPILITADSRKMRHCYRIIRGKMVCVSC